MSEVPLVSVVVCAFNAADYLHRCLDSIDGQTLPRDDLEIVVVNDGSTDATPDIVKAWAASSSRRIRVVHQSNAGLYEARRVGVLNSTGTYVGFVDADDYVEPEMFQSLAASASKAGADLTICAYYEVDGESGNIASRPGFGRSVGVPTPQLFFSSGAPVFLCNKLFTRKSLEHVKANSGVHTQLEDAVAMAQILPHVSQIEVVDDALYYYYRTEASSSGAQGFTASQADSYFRALRALISIGRGQQSPLGDAIVGYAFRSVRWGITSPNRRYVRPLYHDFLNEHYDLLTTLDDLPFRESLQSAQATGTIPPILLTIDGGSGVGVVTEAVAEKAPGFLVKSVRRGKLLEDAPKHMRAWAASAPKNQVDAYAALRAISATGGIYLSEAAELLDDLNLLRSHRAFFAQTAERRIGLHIFGGQAGTEAVGLTIERFESAVARGLSDIGSVIEGVLHTLGVASLNPFGDCKSTDGTVVAYRCDTLTSPFGSTSIVVERTGSRPSGRDGTNIVLTRAEHSALVAHRELVSRNLSKAYRDRDAARRRVRALEGRLKKVESSWSWRLTAGMRAAQRTLKRARVQMLKGRRGMQ